VLLEYPCCHTIIIEGSNIVFIIECICGLVLLVMYSFAVAYLTGEEGPGGPLGVCYWDIHCCHTIIIHIWE
jgi:hypothetical protein